MSLMKSSYGHPRTLIDWILRVLNGLAWIEPCRFDLWGFDDVWPLLTFIVKYLYLLALFYQFTMWPTGSFCGFIKLVHIHGFTLN